MSMIVTRRALVGGLVAGAGSLVAGCDALTDSPTFQSVLTGGTHANQGLQRLISDRGALAKEFRPEQRSPIFRANGNRMPTSPAYQALMANGFADWRLTVGGLVGRPLSLSLAQLRSMPTRHQITRHDCVEGWSAIGKWSGVPLKLLLELAQLRDGARYLVFRCADESRGQAYYESIDLIDAFHPQTILAWALNDVALPVPNGAPLRLRVERMLGYKHAKYLMGIDGVASLDGIGGGKGGFWEDVASYEWYAGI